MVVAKIAADFYSNESRNFRHKLGKVIASSLSGFLAGIIVTAIVMLSLFDIALKQ